MARKIRTSTFLGDQAVKITATNPSRIQSGLSLHKKQLWYFKTSAASAVTSNIVMPLVTWLAPFNVQIQRIRSAAFYAPAAAGVFNIDHVINMSTLNGLFNPPQGTTYAGGATSASNNSDAVFAPGFMEWEFDTPIIVSGGDLLTFTITVFSGVANFAAGGLITTTTWVQYEYA